MKPIRKPRAKRRPEDVLVDDLRRVLLEELEFTLAEKTHGNLYQYGWPDLWCYHPTWYVDGPVDDWSGVYRPSGRGLWLEAKVPPNKLTLAQYDLFNRWSRAGVSIWVATPEDVPYLLELLCEPPNVEEWLVKGPKRTVRAVRDWI